jgi:hypothetical protein
MPPSGASRIGADEAIAHSRRLAMWKTTNTLALSLVGAGMAACVVVENPSSTTSHPSASHSQPAQVSLADLQGMKAAYLDPEMSKRGFLSKGGYQQEGAAFSTWWNASTRQCVSIATRDGSVDTIESIVEGNCL